MGLIIAIIVGALIGWIASMITKTGGGTIMHIVVGIVGSFLGSYVFGGLLHIGSAAASGSFSLAGFFWGVLGAVILIAILKAVGVMGRKS